MTRYQLFVISVAVELAADRGFSTREALFMVRSDVAPLVGRAYRAGATAEEVAAAIAEMIVLE